MLPPETPVSELPLLDSPPSSVTPYAIESGAGERLLAGDQLFALLATQANTDGRFIVLSTIGPAGDRIPKHFHERHTETFFCLDGTMTMWAGDEEIALAPGDFMHVPPGTIHAYRLDSPYMKFVGFLAPGLFEPFFRAMCEPYAGYMFPATPGPVRFDRVMARMAELDLTLVERPGPPAR
jgi:quercetin 2,3-dioxygenase